ncbi:hypothetical protein PILCRDRAFT_810544 [Piloderma croceum F 1598]|uniref:GRIP domain-containing protein n=1 Tax=Piloderma croceum (strain F 1598) TaxID=765440 RepID=A0A0C3GI10_PILCF|nr:hypothetical protein PILCRDRAFT_810544 [Piloderma croceum F 1598]
MSSNGPASPRNSIGDSRSLREPVSSTVSSPAFVDSRLSLDSGRSSPPVNGTNGTPNGRRHDDDDDDDDDDEGLDTVQKLQRELERTIEEKENLATQYRNLLAKLTTMRTTLGNKLKQDAEELDRREQQVQQLTAENDDLSSTVETLKSELIASSAEAERASKELDTMRSRALQDNAQETLLKDRELRETQSELERCRMERDEWERTAMQDKVVVDEARTALESLKRDLELEREAREREAGELELAREQSNNLQSVLEDFQAAKDHELRQAVRDYKSQLDQVTQSLTEFKHRALNAELRLEDTTTDASRTQELEKEVKEKNLLIGKLRHEAVIINEHLMEALRRLRRNSSETNVDRRLVTNVLLSFLTTPRADQKRFEMLQLLASVLSWTDAEREKAGLQRAQPTSATTSFWGRPSNVGSPQKSNPDLEKTDETESFSRLWVEFLLTEANAGGDNSAPPRSPRPNSSLPGSPTHGVYGQSLSPTSAKGTRRLSSFNSAVVASSPNLVLDHPPPRKGKEKAIDL